MLKNCKDEKLEKCCNCSDVISESELLYELESNLYCSDCLLAELVERGFLTVVYNSSNIRTIIPEGGLFNVGFTRK